MLIIPESHADFNLLYHLNVIITNKKLFLLFFYFVEVTITTSIIIQVVFCQYSTGNIQLHYKLKLIDTVEANKMQLLS